MMIKKIAGGMMLTACLLAPLTAAAEYPEKQIQVIMPGSPGGSYDLMNRIVTNKLGERLGKPVIVENVTGAAGMLAMERGAKAEPDGYHFVVGFVGALAANPWLYPKIAYNPVTDFQPVVLYGAAACVLVVPASSPFKTFSDLVDYARANPGKLNFASAGTGTCGHMSGEMLKSAAKLDMVHVPYQSAAPATVALLGSQVDFSFEAMPASIANIRAGKLRPLAVSTLQRSEVLPEIPTVAELGYPGFEVEGWTGLMAPAKAPKEAVTWLNHEINTILQLPEIKKTFADRGVGVKGGTPEDFSKLIKSEIESYGKVIKASGLKSE